MDYEFELVRNMTSLTGLFFICAVTVLVSGCAVNYSSPATGAEHLWGLGQMQFMTNRVGTNLVAVTTGTRVPGLCLELGRNHFGLALGYLVREKADVAEASRLAETEPPCGRPAWHWGNAVSGVWGIGHLKMKTIPVTGGHEAVVTGRALVGAAASIGSGDTSVRFGLDGCQRLTFKDENASLAFDQQAARWPGFDLFQMQVSATVTNSTQ